MFANIFFNRLFIGVLVFVLLLAMGCGLYYGRKVATQEPVKIYKPVEVEQPTSEEPVGNTLPTEPDEGGKLPLVDASDKHNRVAAPPPSVAAPAPQPSGYPPLPPSSVPDDIPEHLKFPEKWKNGYYYGFSEGPEPTDISMEEAERGVSILREIIRDYNPQRPIGDIWHQFIAYEKMYRAYAEVDLGKTPFGGLSYNRADWLYEQTWAFPEIMDIAFGDSSEDEWSLFTNARSIAMGQQEPHWNEHIMHDGRAFYLRGDTTYKFKWTTPTGVERTTTFSRTLTPKATVVIYPDETSDEELERLGWWNFHINPYTLQPVDYQPYNIKD